MVWKLHKILRYYSWTGFLRHEYYIHAPIMHYEITRIKQVSYHWNYLYSINPLCQYLRLLILNQIFSDTWTLVTAFLHQLVVWPDELGCGLRGTLGTAEFTTLMQVIVLPLAYRCRQRLSRWLYQSWPALAGNGRSALSPAQPLPARKAKILLAVLYETMFIDTCTRRSALMS